MANGFALSALVGSRDIMELGGLNHDKQRVFLLSTTHGAEHHALAADLSPFDWDGMASVGSSAGQLRRVGPPPRPTTPRWPGSSAWRRIAGR